MYTNPMALTIPQQVIGCFPLGCVIRDILSAVTQRNQALVTPLASSARHRSGARLILELPGKPFSQLSSSVSSDKPVVT